MAAELVELVELFKIDAPVFESGVRGLTGFKQEGLYPGVQYCCTLCFLSSPTSPCMIH